MKVTGHFVIAEPQPSLPRLGYPRHIVPGVETPVYAQKSLPRLGRKTQFVTVRGIVSFDNGFLRTPPGKKTPVEILKHLK